MEEPEAKVTTAKDGTRIAYLDEGGGEPVLLIPGLGYASWSWYPQIEYLRSRARVLAMDNRGSGRSDAPSGQYSISLMADDAAAVISSAPRPVHIVGASMGGYIALTLALRHPDMVKSLILVATTSGGDGCAPVPRQTLRAWGNASVLGPQGYARATMPFSFAPGWVDKHPKEFEALLDLRLRHPTSSRAWRSQFQACAEYIRLGLPQGDISAPTLIIHGTADRVVPYRNMAHLAQRLPDADTFALDGAGHLCWIEEQDRVNELIAEHIKNAP